MTDRSIARERASGDRQGGAEEKRRQILDAAVRVFARRGFHTSRVGDIAEEAGVAHGLLYHYFSSKDEVLQTVFRENWGELLARFEAVEASDEPADEKLRGIVKILLRTWRNDPDLVTVMVREVGRSAQLASQVDDIGKGFEVIQRVIEQGQAEGVFRPELDPRLASWVVYGGLEEILTGWVMGRLPDGDEEVARAERTIVDVVRGGLVRTPSPPDAAARARHARPRGGRARPRLGADDDRCLPAADPRALHRLDDARRARARRGGVLRADAAARDRPVERHVPHAARAPAAVHARRARADGVRARADARSCRTSGRRR